MFILKAENRNTGLKPKQLRRMGIIPATVYGKSLDKSLSIQFSHGEIARFLKSSFTGSRVDLALGNEKYPVLLKDTTYTPASGALEHLSFQVLKSDEVVSSTIKIVLLNREKISAMIQQTLSEVPYKALPSNLIDSIEIDLEGMQTGDSVRISDLEVANNENVEILIPLDTMVVSIVDNRKVSNESEEDEDEGEETEA